MDWRDFGKREVKDMSRQCRDIWFGAMQQVIFQLSRQW
jgi:hypothetical protein